MSSLLAISINIGMILAYTITIKGTNPVFYVGFAEVLLLRVLSVSQLTTQIALFIIVVINRAPIILNGAGKSNVIVEKPTEHVEYSSNSKPLLKGRFKSLKRLTLKLKEAVNITLTHFIPKIARFSWHLLNDAILVLGSEDDFLLLLGLCVLSFFGVFYGSFIFVIHLVEIFVIFYH